MEIKEIEAIRLSDEDLRSIERRVVNPEPAFPVLQSEVRVLLDHIRWLDDVVERLKEENDSHRDAHHSGVLASRAKRALSQAADAQDEIQTIRALLGLPEGTSVVQGLQALFDKNRQVINGLVYMDSALLRMAEAKRQFEGALGDQIFTQDGHEFRATATSELGIQSGRVRYRLVCATCEVVVHEGTTGPREQAKYHVRDSQRST